MKRSSHVTVSAYSLKSAALVTPSRQVASLKFLERTRQAFAARLAERKNQPDVCQASVLAGPLAQR